jgi:hypothetical protein
MSFSRTLQNNPMHRGSCVHAPMPAAPIVFSLGVAARRATVDPIRAPDALVHLMVGNARFHCSDKAGAWARRHFLPGDGAEPGAVPRGSEDRNSGRIEPSVICRRLYGLVDQNIVAIAPYLDALHTNERAFEKRARQDNGMLIAETLRNEQAIAVPAFVQHIKSVGGGCAHGSSLLSDVDCGVFASLCFLICLNAASVERNLV